MKLQSSRFHLSKFLKMETYMVLFLLTHIVVVTVAKMNRQEEKQLEEKYGKLIEMSARENALTFNGNRFRKFARNTPRNYSIIIMFTALATGRGCKICREVSNEFHIVADSFKIDTKKRRNQPQKQFFVSIDFDTAPDAFQIMNLEQAPVIMHFPEKGKPQKVDTMDLSSKGFSADAMAKFVEERTGAHIRIVRPTNVQGLGTLFVIFVVICFILYFRFDNLQFLYNTKGWGILILGFVVIMVSGQMYNNMKGVPVAEKTSEGVSFINSNPQMQFVAESYIIIMLHGGIVVGMIMLTDVQKGHVSKRRTFAIIGIVLLALFYSIMLSIFRYKNEDYPFSFLFK